MKPARKRHPDDGVPSTELTETTAVYHRTLARVDARMARGVERLTQRVEEKRRSSEEARRKLADSDELPTLDIDLDDVENQ